MKHTSLIGWCVLIVAGCSPTKKIDERYRQTYQIVANTTNECIAIVIGGRADELEALDRKDAWGTPIRAFLAHGGGDTILVVAAAGADKLHHTRDDVTETQSVSALSRNAQQ